MPALHVTGRGRGFCAAQEITPLIICLKPRWVSRKIWPPPCAAPARRAVVLRLRRSRPRFAIRPPRLARTALGLTRPRSPEPRPHTPKICASPRAMVPPAPGGGAPLHRRLRGSSSRVTLRCRFCRPSVPRETGCGAPFWVRWTSAPPPAKSCAPRASTPWGSRCPQTPR